jgi:hypothetical protein
MRQTGDAMDDHDDHGRQPRRDGGASRPIRRVTRPARDALASLTGGVAAAAEPLVDLVNQAVEGVERSIAERPGARVRRVRQRANRPLPYLNDVLPDVRRARPVQVGLRTIPVDDIAGTAVGGGTQRGGDFLPLKPFRGPNWTGRWQRLRRAQDDLAILPPIEVQKYDGRYWVIDGHNRVAAALYAGQPEIDASIVELVPPGARRSEPVVELAPSLTGSRALRTRGAGRRTSDLLDHEDRSATDLPDDEA